MCFATSAGVGNTGLSATFENNPVVPGNTPCPGWKPGGNASVVGGAGGVVDGGTVVCALAIDGPPTTTNNAASANPILPACLPACLPALRISHP